MPQRAGIHYHLLSRPDQPTLIFLHGFLGSLDDWQLIPSELSDKFGLLTIDLPGHGQSLSTDAADYSIENCAKNIIDLCDQLQLKRLILVGYSMGGRVALYLLTYYPDRFERAVIESATPGLMTDSERQTRIAHDNALAKQLEQTNLKSWLSRWFAQPLFDSLGEQADLLETMIRSRMNNDKTGLALSLRMMTTGRQPDLWSKLGEIKIPLLLIAGELDSKYTQIIKQTADLCPNAQPVIIKKAGHNVHLAQPTRYLDELIRFLTHKKKDY